MTWAQSRSLRSAGSNSGFGAMSFAMRSHWQLTATPCFVWYTRDADQNREVNRWTSGGGMHVWALTENRPATPWQADLDGLMQQQTAILDYRKRKQAYDRVQEILSEHEPVIFLVSPNVLAGAKDSIEGIKPAVLRRHLLWNAEQLFLKRQDASAGVKK